MSLLSRLPLLAALGFALMLPAAAQPAADLSSRYSACAFNPLLQGCDAVYQAALKDQSPAAGAVRAAFDGYARYMKTTETGLSEADRAWLKANTINVPDLDAASLAGLHNVLNDPALQKDSSAKLNTVMGFISRAVQAHLYCYFNSCPGAQDATGGS